MLPFALLLRSVPRIALTPLIGMVSGLFADIGALRHGTGHLFPIARQHLGRPRVGSQAIDRFDRGVRWDEPNGTAQGASCRRDAPLLAAMRIAVPGAMVGALLASSKLRSSPGSILNAWSTTDARSEDPSEGASSSPSRTRDAPIDARRSGRQVRHGSTGDPDSATSRHSARPAMQRWPPCGNGRTGNAWPARSAPTASPTAPAPVREAATVGLDWSRRGDPGRERFAGTRCADRRIRRDHQCAP